MKRFLFALIALGAAPCLFGNPAQSVSTFPDLLSASPQGWNASAGWAPARMNDVNYSASTTGYAYPEPRKPVRLFLIDTAVDNSTNWFGGNPNLYFEFYQSTYESNSTSPTTGHGTKMLSIIAGPQAGIAPGTPIHVVNYNIAYGQTVPSLTDIGSAIYDAIDYQDAHPGMPAVICCALGSEVAGQSYMVNAAIAEAVNSGITVIFSAGNQNATAANYSPSSNGTLAGAICVGASTSSNTRLSASNYGTAVDFYCPGQNVLCYDPANKTAGQGTPMSGTSPATAIATGAAILELSANPTTTPAQLETLLKSRLAAKAVSILQIPVPDDIDGDGSPNAIEAFFGTNWASRSSVPAGMKLQHNASSTTIEFTVANGILSTTDSSKLAAGGYWRVLKQGANDTWSPAPSGPIVLGTSANGKTPVSITFPDTDTSASYRLEIEFN
ncbi:hypothetical protein HNR46_001259 [Haloferula luteola]|uniref:Peptidase S8/S53 domain-containing protein n=1 Tax=Haloferula luteola TaxID=595692 RepID=A0A840UZ57_9BACT|nr:S8 family serine peptidase [Haloferula luteola]MBB5351025.1 hypothetical protein [Haloferula luteola]